MVRKRKRKEEPFSDILHLKRTETVLYDSQASSSNNIKKKSVQYTRGNYASLGSRAAISFTT